MEKVGYIYLIEKYNLKSIPHWHTSSIVQSKPSKSIKDGSEYETFLKRSWPGDMDCDHLIFALKNDGINLAILSQR